jgi:hypothetical protein
VAQSKVNALKEMFPELSLYAITHALVGTKGSIVTRCIHLMKSLAYL